MKTKSGLPEVNRYGVLSGVVVAGTLALSACSDEPATNPYENLGNGGAGGLAPTNSQTIPSPTQSQPVPSNTEPVPSDTVPAPSQTVPSPGGTGGAPPAPTAPLPTPAPTAAGGMDGTGGMGAGGAGGNPQQPDAGTEIVLPSDAGLPEDDAGDAGDAGDADGPDASTDTDTEDDAGASDTETTPDAASTEPTETETDTDTEPPVEPLWDLDVECRWSLAGERTDQERIGIQFLLQNNEATALDLRDLRLEYYYDADGHAATQSVAVYFYPIQGTTGQLESMGVQATTGADHRLELAFSACTTGCTLAANMSAPTLLANLAILSGANSPRFDVTDDYSHVATDPGVGGTTESANPCEYIGVFLGDELVYGLPPNTVLP